MTLSHYNNIVWCDSTTVGSVHCSIAYLIVLLLGSMMTFLMVSKTCGFLQ